MEPKLDVQQWLKTIDIWDPKYDYLMHNHWLTSEWSPDCEQCRLKEIRPESVTLTNSPRKLSLTFDQEAISSASIEAADTKVDNNYMRDVSPPPLPQEQKIVATPEAQPPAQPSEPLPPRPQPELIIPMTPIAPHMSSRPFVTPKTSNRVNDTFTRSTRQSTRKLLNQASHQDLIDLNETFDLYKSALEETPVAENQPTVDEKKQLSKLPRFGYSRVS